MGQERNLIRRFKTILGITLACFCLLLVQSQRVFGQVDEGSIAGTVLDSSGAAVAGAQVTLLNTDVGLSLQQQRRLLLLAGQNRPLHPLRDGQGLLQNHPAEHHRRGIAERSS